MPRIDRSWRVLPPRLAAVHIEEIRGAESMLVLEPEIVTAYVGGRSVRIGLPPGSIILPPGYSIGFELARPEWVNACTIRWDWAGRKIVKVAGEGESFSGRAEPREPGDPVALFAAGLPGRGRMPLRLPGPAAVTIGGAPVYGYLRHEDGYYLVEFEGEAYNAISYILPLIARCVAGR